MTNTEESPIPVIFDTDIGTDIDDTWALALLLASPELDLKLVVTASGDTRARARIAAKFLAACGRSDVPVAIGVEGSDIPLPQLPWAAGYELTSYPGPILEDGVQATIDQILAADEETVLLAVGPVPNLAEALRREPAIVDKARVVAMSGSIDRGYGGSEEAHPEYNVRADAAAARAMYTAAWDLLIAPLDTAGQVQLKGDLYRRLLRTERPGTRALLESYRTWASRVEWGSHDPETESSVLFDALAVALVFRPEICEIEELTLAVTEDGFTRRYADASLVRAALSWKEPRGALEELLVDRLA